MDSFLEALDPEQRQVAEAVTGAVCVRAGAGTGKTRAIVYRIANAVRMGVVDPRRILAVTFTARAAGEMRSRLRDMGVSHVRAMTFHSAALSQLTYFWPMAIGGRVPEIKESKLPLISAAASQLGIPNDVPTIKDLAAEIEWSKVSLVTPQDYPACARQAGRIGVAEQSPEDIGRLISVYEEVKTERGVIDFEDVILILIGILLDRPDIARVVRDQYRYFVVDEYQDVSPMQHRLLQLWIGDRRDVCVVGDAAQTIYTFAGARSSYLENFKREYSRSTEITLDRNYRSTPEILELANAVVSEGAGVRPVRLRAMNPSGAAVLFHSYEHGSQEAEHIAGMIKQLANKGTKLDRLAILYRTNAQSGEFERALDAMGVPFILRGQESFFQRKEVREAMVMFRAHAREERADIGVGEALALPEIVESALRNMGWRPEGPQARGASRERWESLDALRALAEELWNARRASIHHFVAELEERAETHNVPAINAVTLSSLHAAKGLEWDTVFLAGMIEGLMPISYAERPEDIEEEKRLLYVGITRAKKELHLSYAKTYGGRSPGKLSRFLEPLWPLEQSRSTQARHRAQAEANEFERGDPQAVYVFEKLKEWRLKVAQEINKPAYVVFNDSTLRAIATVQPESLTELSAIRGVGQLKLATYGLEVLAVIRS